MNMERRFNLIKSDFEKHEKRILPRFPFCYLTFKSDKNSRVYEIKDISHTGMQLSLKDEEDMFDLGESFKGHIHWLGKNLDVSGAIKWQTPSRVGLEFHKKHDLLEKVQAFLRPEEIVKNLKPLHKVEGGLDIPSRLKCWLRSDGPTEIFVWQHSDGEIAKCQVLFLELFVEWEDGVGLKTGRTLSKRNVDSPLLSEDEWVFQIDADPDQKKVERVGHLISLIPQELLASEIKTFLARQLS